MASDWVAWSDGFGLHLSCDVDGKHVNVNVEFGALCSIQNWNLSLMIFLPPVSNAGMHLNRVECAKYNPECMNLSTSKICELVK